MIGKRIGNYRVTAQLGEGGMGVVYRAEHPVIGKKVALKVLRPELTANAEAVKRFIAEARAVNAIGHPNIVDIFDFAELPDGGLYFTMELLAGESLSTRLSRGRLPVALALDLATQVATALQAAHACGIVHRDVKPDNIFLVPRSDGAGPFVKVVDFGIAKLFGRELRASLRTATGSIFGTPY
ncbi:MAG: serine/threonine-protein kinase, partial [Myxococcota bacterium]